MKKVLIYSGLAIVIIGAAAWTWTRTADYSPELAEGLHVKCTNPACQRVFVIPWDQSRTYPRGPQGEGFRCPKCSQFAGQIASQCERCKGWFVTAELRGAGCPKCDRTPGSKALQDGSSPPRR